MNIWRDSDFIYYSTTHSRGVEFIYVLDISKSSCTILKEKLMTKMKSRKQCRYIYEEMGMEWNLDSLSRWRASPILSVAKKSSNAGTG